MIDTMEISMHHADLEIIAEFPENGLMVVLRVKNRHGSMRLTLYMKSNEQRKALLSVIPKAKDYVFFSKSQEDAA